MSATAPLPTAPTQERPAPARAGGEQIPVPGVAPVALRDRLALRLAAPMTPRKPQKPLTVGLGACPRAGEAGPGDEDARNQLALF